MNYDDRELTASLLEIRSFSPQRLFNIPHLFAIATTLELATLSETAKPVPLKALGQRGCKTVIVIHLQNGSAWNRHDFLEQTIIEIRPEKVINKSEIPVVGVVDSWLDFSTQRISQLQQQGYEDAKRCLNPIINSLITVREYRQSQVSLLNSTQQLLNDSPL